MLATNRTALILSLVAAAVISTGCVKDAPTVLDASVTAAQDVNPDPAGRPSPIVVRFYALKSLKAFDTAAFFDIYEKASETFGADLISWGEVDLIPGASKPLNVTLSPETRHVGFLAAFRSIDQATWRGSVDIAPNQTTSVAVGVEKLVLSVKPN